MTRPSSSQPLAERPRRFGVARVVGLALLACVLALAFIGHLTPAMKVQWANFMSFCGF